MCGRQRGDTAAGFFSDEMLITEEKMAGSDRRTQKTIRAIKEELMRQMLYKKYNELTVSGICAALDISRRTFYLHFYGIDDVFEKIFDDINQPVYQKFGELQKSPASEGPSGSSIAPSGREELIYEIFDLLNETVRNHTEYLTRLSTEPSYHRIQAWHISLVKRMINEHLTRLEIGSEIRRAYLDYYVAGILELYFQWYRHDHSLTLDDIRDYALGIINADMEYFLPTFKLKRERE